MAAAPLTLGMRFLIQVAPPAVAYWLAHGGISGFGRADEVADDFIVARCTVGWRRRPSSDPTDSAEDDLMQFGLSFLNVTGGDPDPTWTEADFLACETNINGLINSLCAEMSNHCSLESYTWHLFTPGNDPGELVRQLLWPPTATINGDRAQQPLPPQVASSITLRTGSRRHWGRIYVPALTAFSLGTDGRWTNQFVDAMVLSWSAFHEASVTDDFHPVIVSKTAKSAMGIGACECDDVPDIIRRRRWKRSVYRNIHELTP